MPMSLLLVISLFPWIPVQAQKCQVTYSQPNVKIQGHVIKSLSTPTSNHCVDECKGHQHCHSINFDQAKELCELNNATHLTNPGSMVYSRGCQYLNYFLRPAANCSNKLCSNPRDICVMDSDGLNYNCTTQFNSIQFNLSSNTTGKGKHGNETKEYLLNHQNSASWARLCSFQTWYLIVKGTRIKTLFNANIFIFSRLPRCFVISAKRHRRQSPARECLWFLDRVYSVLVGTDRS